MVRAMRQVVQEDAFDWLSWYEVREQTRQNVAGKRGKRRPIMDIEFERHCRGSRPRLAFEAKPLRRGKSVGAYLGAKGLATFFSGDALEPDHAPTQIIGGGDAAQAELRADARGG